MRWSLVFLVAACGDSGVVLAVDPNGIAIDETRVYLGVGEPLTRPDGINAWTRDPGNVDDHGPGASTFTLVSDGSAETLPAVIAVGYRDGQAVAAASQLEMSVPNSDFYVYTLELAERTIEFDFQVFGPTDDVLPSDAMCVGLHDARITPEYPSAFIVAPGDRDCDGFGDTDALECDPDTYHSQRPAARDELTCTVAPTDGVCLLGGPTCIDGEPHVASECSPSTYCASPRLCQTCSGIACASDITPLVPTELPFHIQCTLHAAAGAFCGDVALPPLPIQRTCLDAAIRDADQNFGTSIEHGAISIALTRPNNDCNGRLVPSGTVTDAGAVIGGLIAVDLDNGKGLAVPVVVIVKPDGCTNIATCTLTGAESGAAVAACIQ